MPTFNSNTIVTLPTSNIFENQYSHFELLNVNDVDPTNITGNVYIEKYFNNTNKVIKISDLFNRYIKCGGIHTITSQEEQDFFIELDGIPLTKKYYYVINEKIDATHIDNKYKITISFHTYNLIYNNLLKHNLFTNGYLQIDSYLNSLPFNSLVSFDIIFREKEFLDFNDFTSYVFSSDFDIDIMGHFNCILFDDIISQDVITNGSNIDIITEKAFSNKFIFYINENDFFVEGDIDSYSFKILNDKDGTIINEFNLEISHVPLYKNIIYIKDYDAINSKVIYDMCLLDRLNPITNDYIVEYFNIISGNKYFFETFNIWTSTKLSNRKDLLNANLFTDKYFNNIYQIETIESESFNVINIQTDLATGPRIIKAYPFNTLEEKFKITAIVGHSSSLHNIRNFVGKQNILIDYTTSAQQSTGLTIEDQDGTSARSTVVPIQNPIIVTDYINNGNITHSQKDIENPPFIDATSLVSKTLGSYFTDFKFFGGAKKLNDMQGDLLVPCFEGHAAAVDYEYNLSYYKTLNNMNISQYKLTNLNESNNAFTFIFMTNKYGYLNNQMKLGDFQENIYGRIVLFKDVTTSLADMVYHVDVTNWDNTDIYDSLLHIITHENDHVTYEVQSDTTLMCSLDSTINISKCNISTLNTMTHKKTKNQTILAETDSTVPSMKDIKYYYNTVQLDNITNTGYIYTIDKSLYEEMAMSKAAQGLSDATMIDHYDTSLYDIIFVIEFNAPDTTGQSGFEISAELGSDVQGSLYKGRFPDNLITGNNRSTPRYRGAIGSFVGTSSGILDDREFYSTEIDFTSGEELYIVLFSKIEGTGPFRYSTTYQTWGGFSYDELYFSIRDPLNPEYSIKPMPVPLGYDKFMQDWGYNSHQTRINEYMSIGHHHIYNQVLSPQRINKIKQVYQNNRTNNTALFLD